MIKGSLIQSRLDKFYCSNQGWWINSFLGLKHLPTQILLNHDPMYFTCQIGAPAINSSRKTSFFKVNPKNNSALEHQAQLRKAWRAGLAVGDDPRTKFHLAHRQLRATYKKIQQTLKKQDTRMECLRKSLLQIKAHLALTSIFELLNVYVITSTMLWRLEM